MAVQRTPDQLPEPSVLILEYAVMAFLSVGGSAVIFRLYTPCIGDKVTCPYRENASYVGLVSGEAVKAAS